MSKIRGALIKRVLIGSLNWVFTVAYILYEIHVVKGGDCKEKN